MPWKKVEPMDQKILLIAKWQEHENITLICDEIGISRKTAHKWINRYKVEGLDGLKDRTKAPKSHPNETPKHIQKRIVDEKIKRPHWGPKKIIQYLKDTESNMNLPANSTAGSILEKNDLVRHRKRRPKVPAYSTPFIDSLKPNDVWSIDYKGQFLTLSNQICYPLTLTDNSSRFILSIEAFPGPRYAPTRNTMERVFGEYGLPLAIRSDNGVPFAGKAVGGLSRLSIWWIKLGIRPERIKPGHPEQNGRHERMHRTLKDCTTKPPGHDLADQQVRFDDFIFEFNYQRPHEAIDMKTPSKVYIPSLRDYHEPLDAIDYADDFLVRKVLYKGEIKFKGKRYFISELLPGENIGLKEVEEDLYQMFYSFHSLGYINTRRKKLLKYTGKVLPKSPV